MKHFDWLYNYVHSYSFYNFNFNIDINIEYNANNHWIVNGIWNISERKELLNRMKILQPVEQNSSTEIVQLRKQLRIAEEEKQDFSQQKKRYIATIEQNETELQHKDILLQRKDVIINETMQAKNDILKIKDNIIHEEWMLQYKRKI